MKVLLFGSSTHDLTIPRPSFCNSFFESKNVQQNNWVEQKSIVVHLGSAKSSKSLGRVKVQCVYSEVQQKSIMIV